MVYAETVTYLKYEYEYLCTCIISAHGHELVRVHTRTSIIICLAGFHTEGGVPWDIPPKVQFSPPPQEFHITMS